MSSFVRNLDPNAKAGSVNLTCPQCEIPVDFLDIQERGLREIHPERLFPCPQCPTLFWPENAFLFQLHEGDSDVYFGHPLTLGATSGLNYTDVRVGHSTEFNQHSIDEGYEITSTVLRGAKPNNSEKDLEVNEIDGAYTRASLGQEVLLSVIPTGYASVALNATLRDNAEDTIVEADDQIDVQYRYVKAPQAATNPPWIDLLKESSLTIRRKNTLAMYPLLVSAMDNFLYRQCLLYHRWQGLKFKEAKEDIESYGGYHGPDRYDIVEDIFRDLGVGDLTTSSYSEDWDWFCDMNDERNDIVHPDANLLEELDRADAIEYFNRVMGLIVDIFDHIWFDDE